MSGRQYSARITPVVGGSAITVTVPAADPFQARALIEQIYGPVRAWWIGPAMVPAREGERP